MKHICISVALLFPFLTQAQITYPTANTVLYPGDRFTVRWNPENSLGHTLLILLSSSKNPFPGGEITHNWMYLDFDGAENALGRFDWTVPDDVTDDMTYRILLYGDVPLQYLASPVFQIRFGKKRTIEPVLTIRKNRDVHLTWSGIYGHTYVVEESANLRDWDVREMVHAIDENLETTAPVTSVPHYFRLRDVTP